MNNLKITTIQSDLFWENKEKNLEQFSDKINAIAEDVDLIVLPEMFTTGFSMDAEKLAEPMNGTTVNWMKQKAMQKKCAITGSFIAEENGKYYNRLVWMNADGTQQHYDKRHLFTFGQEDKHYTKGNEKIIVDLKGWKICPLICYDLRFPVWSRNTIIESSNKNQESGVAYDVLIYIANWPERRSHPWKTLLLARAIENQCYVVGVNRIGNDNNEIYHSAIINPKGEIISKTEPHKQSVETVILNFDELNEFRKVFPVMNDGDGFEVSIK